jgi:hypothetical protein
LNKNKILISALAGCLAVCLVAFQNCSGSSGSAGSAGAAGADGALRVYGDGSAGALTISANTDWTIAPPANLQFTDVTIAAGVILNVPSGTVIRCSGSFTNNGTITVTTGGLGASSSTNGGEFEINPAAQGIAESAAASGEFGDNTVVRIAGRGGVAFGQLSLRDVVLPGPDAGGGGGTAVETSAAFKNGGPGGGSLVVLAKTAIVNSATGVIHADAGVPGAGGGGGAGGVVILATPGALNQAGSISANGTNGGAANIDVAGGGGGGGGLIHFISPSLTNGGTNAVLHGLGAAGGTIVSTSPRSAGGGGGACAGNGGIGGAVATNGSGNAASAANPGTDGLVLTTAADPSSMF